MGRTRKPGSVGVPLCQDPLDIVTAKMMYGAATLRMDEYAEELFELWFHGKTKGEVVLDNDKWKRYMSANDDLKRLTLKVLLEHAASCQSIRPGQTGRRGSLQRQFHAEVGGKAGDYHTGYGLLHGTNEKVGDFQMQAEFAAREIANPAGGLEVVYRTIAFVWNDVMDVNKRYKSDPVMARTCRNIAKCLRTGPPKDYILRIKWRADDALVVIVDANGKVVSSSYKAPSAAASTVGR